MSKLNEQDVLKQLNVNDFKNLPSEKQYKLIALFPQIEQDVAEKVLKQCPAIVNTVITTAKEENSSNENDGKAAVESIHKSLNCMVDDLSALIKDNDTLSTNKKPIIALIVKIADILLQTNRLNQALLAETQKSDEWKCLAGCFGVFFVLVIICIFCPILWPAFPIAIGIVYKGRKLV